MRGVAIVVLAAAASAFPETSRPRSTRVRRLRAEPRLPSGISRLAEKPTEAIKGALQPELPRRSYAPPGEFYECGTLDREAEEQRLGPNSQPFRTLTIVAAFLAYPLIVRSVAVIPPPNPTEGGYFFSLISIVFGTLTASTISDATGRLGALRAAAVEECTLMLPLVQTLEVFLLEDVRSPVPVEERREVFAACAEQLWLHSTDLIAGTRELELDAMTCGVDNLGALYRTLQRAQCKWRGELDLESARATCERLMEARGVRLSLENSGIPPVQFSVLRALSAALAIAFTYLTLDRPAATNRPHFLGFVEVDGAVVFDDSFGVHVLFAFICGALVVFNSLAADFNRPFSGVYRLESNTVAASLKQLRSSIRPYVSTTPLGRLRPSNAKAAKLYKKGVDLPSDF